MLISSTAFPGASLACQETP